MNPTNNLGSIAMMTPLSDFAVDPILMKRCKIALAESGGRIHDADDLTDALRKKFPEYDRRKRAIFRALVTEYFRVLDVDEELAEANRSGTSAHSDCTLSGDCIAFRQIGDQLITSLRCSTQQGQQIPDNLVLRTSHGRC